MFLSRFLRRKTRRFYMDYMFLQYKNMCAASFCEIEIRNAHVFDGLDCPCTQGEDGRSLPGKGGCRRFLCKFADRVGDLLASRPIEEDQTTTRRPPHQAFKRPLRRDAEKFLKKVCRFLGAAASIHWGAESETRPRPVRGHASDWCLPNVRCSAIFKGITYRCGRACSPCAAKKSRRNPTLTI